MINDTIKPMGLDLTKNLHGHVRVETRDRWTGRVVDSQEKDNLVTSAISKIYKMAKGVNYQLWNWFTPIYSKALGGIMLFDGTLTESADNYLFPGGVNLMGFAGQTANSSNPKGGSLNGSESLEGSNFYTSVWDFGTSQANGTIASISRTSYLFPDYVVGVGAVNNISIWSPSNMGPYSWGTGSVIRAIGYDSSNKYLYFALSAAQTYNNVTYGTDKVYRANVDFENQKLLTQYYIPNPDRWTEVFTVTSAAHGTTTASALGYDRFADKFYYALGTSLYVISLTGSASTITLPVSVYGAFWVSATENYYWVVSGTNVYRVSKSNPADVASTALSSNSAASLALSNDSVMVGVSNNVSIQNYVIIHDDLSLCYFDAFSLVQGATLNGYSYGQVTPPVELLDVYMSCPGMGATYASSGRGVFLYTCYLGTIANLPSPVTKTSSQTMKITYTLTEA